MRREMITKGALIRRGDRYYVIEDIVGGKCSCRHVASNLKYDFDLKELLDFENVRRGAYCDLNLNAMLGKECMFDLGMMTTKGHVREIKIGVFRVTLGVDEESEIEFPISVVTDEGDIRMEEIQHIHVIG